MSRRAQRVRRGAELRISVAQRRAETFLDHRVVERQLEHFTDGQAELVRPREQVRQVFRIRSEHFRAQQQASSNFGVYMMCPIR